MLVCHWHRPKFFILPQFGQISLDLMNYVHTEFDALPDPVKICHT